MCGRIDYRHADPRRATSRPIPIAKVKTLTRGLQFDLLTTGTVHAEVER